MWYVMCVGKPIESQTPENIRPLQPTIPCSLVKGDKHLS